jgi:hypothetical protein
MIRKIFIAGQCARLPVETLFVEEEVDAVVVPRKTIALRCIIEGAIVKTSNYSVQTVWGEQ